MHRKIRTVVDASSRETAIETSITALRNGMDDEILPDGTLQTLVGEHTPLSPSTYFDTEKDEAAYLASTEHGQAMLEEAAEHTGQHSHSFIFEVVERTDYETVSPIPTQNKCESFIQSLIDDSVTYWVVTFDLRYDFDATPHGPYEILQ